MKRSWKLFIEDVLECIENIELYTDGMGYDDFCKNQLIVDAVMKNLMVIGEACKHVPENIKSKFVEIPWKSITGLRNIAIHVYYELDLPNVWKIIKEDLPANKTSFQKIITKHNF